MELEELGYQVLGVHNILHPRTKAPLPIFFVDLVKNDKSSQIFSLEFLYHTKILIEEPRRRNEIVQCKRCQSYGHTKSYCNLKPRCVKCAGAHLSSSCKKPLDIPPKCVLCEEAHPANYRGCSVHKELKKLRQRPPVRSLEFYEEQETNQPSKKEKEVSSKIVQNSAGNLEPPFQPIPDCVQRHNIATEPTYSYKLTRSNDTLTPNLPPNNTSNVPDITTQLTNFINEFKNLVSPLITLLTSLVQHVLPKLIK